VHLVDDDERSPVAALEAVGQRPARPVTVESVRSEQRVAEVRWCTSAGDLGRGVLTIASLVSVGES
jgi:hypothetical protein